jgi:acyl-CoA synthetase (AMP-forming)/AMP-acid ligase II
MPKRFGSLVEMLRYRAAVTPGTRAYTFLADGEIESDSLTYAELDLRARAIAATLTLRGLKRGDRAILLYPPGLDFVPAFFGSLYAGVIAVPCYPPHPSQIARALPRLLAVVGDADAAVVLAPENIVALAPEIARLAPPLGRIPWIATDRCDHDAASLWRDLSISSDWLAFLQYTSGSTSTPRGVMVSHGNLLHNLAYANYVEENDASSVAVSWLPVIHDMGLIEGVLEPAFAGYPAYLMAPATFLQRPIRWLRAITRYRATNSGGPNFAYDLCTRKITPEQQATLDLSTWRVAYNGAEPIRSDTLAAFHRAFAEQGFRWRSFYPVYGLAEATLLVSSGRLAYEPVFRDAEAEALGRGHVIAPDPKRAGETSRSSTLVSSGQIAFGTTVAIVNPDTCMPCVARQIGEIWISSPSVARGYWNRLDETAHTFNARLAHGDLRTFLRTGDSGVVIDGELYVVGRLKDVIIVRGMNHYPQDIETTVERLHPAIRPGCCAAFAVPGHGGERVVVAVEVDPRELARTNRGGARIHPATPLSPDALRVLDDMGRQIRGAVTEQHGIQLEAVAILLPGGIPKTSSGKLRRHAAAHAFAQHELNEIVRLTNDGPEALPAVPSLLRTGT